MYQEIINKLQNKSIAILGFGREGKSTYNFIKNNLNDYDITIIDGNDKLLENNSYLLEDKSLKFIIGDNYLDNLNKYDLIIKTPGVSFKDIDVTDIKDKITSQLELVLECFKDNTIGITGTKGKSTTTSLIYNIFKDQGKDVYLLGNIGIPLFNYVHEFGKDSVLVIEMSAHQLEYVKVSPKYGIILNLFEEHLDHFGSLDNYYNAKLNMFKYQEDDDYALYCLDNDTLNNYVLNNNYRANKISVSYDKKASIYCDNEYVYSFINNNHKRIYNINDKRYLLGKHNLIDIMFVFGVSELFNLDINKTILTINNFKGLEHRLELVGTYNDVIYYNDAIATIPEATISAIETLNNVDTLIFGGLDRGIDYSSFIKYLSKCNVTNLIAMKDSGYKIGREIEEMGTDNKIYYANDLKDAVRLAKLNTKKGYICLMSPAAPSYNDFKNFEEKGTMYKQLIKNDEEDL